MELTNKIFIIYKTMDEIDEIINKRSLSEQSKKTYRNLYNKLKSNLGEIKTSNEDEIINVIKELSNDKVSNKLSYLNIAIMIKQHYEMELNKLLKKRDLLVSERDKQQKNITMDLPEYNDVKKYVNDLTGVKYIVNYLIFNYGIRNKDINVFITDDVKLTKKNNEINYLLVKPNSVKWIINDYKTLLSYGNKSKLIKTKKLVEEVNKLPINTWLLSGTDVSIAESSLNNIVARMLYKHNDKHMNESSYFKLNIKHLQTQPKSLKKIMELGEMRGTDVKTIEKYYDMK